MTQFQRDIGIDMNDPLTISNTMSTFTAPPSSSTGTPFPDHMDVANQQTQRQQQPATHALASSDANNNQATLPLQRNLNKIGRLGSPSDQKDNVNSFKL